MPVITAPGAWPGVRLATLVAALHRLSSTAVPVEAVPSGWPPVPVLSPPATPDDSPTTGAELDVHALVAAALDVAAVPPRMVPVTEPTLDDMPIARVQLPPIVVAPPPTPAVQAADKPRVTDPGHSPAVERASSTLAQRIGDDAERLAAFRLEALGWQIVGRNVRLIRAEIDLLAIDPAQPPHLVIVEVRRRTRRDFGLAEESVDHRKRAALRRAAGELAARPVLPDGRRLPNLPVRVDLVAIDRGPDGRPALRHHRGIEL